MKHLAMLAAGLILMAAGSAGAQTSDASAHADPYLPPALRQPATGTPASGAALRGQAMEKLKRRFDQADTDGNGQLTLEEARKAGLGMVVKNFDQIDRAHSGHISFDDLKAYLILRRSQTQKQ
jgi:hypothetical protein